MKCNPLLNMVASLPQHKLAVILHDDFNRLKVGWMMADECANCNIGRFSIAETVLLPNRDTPLQKMLHYMVEKRETNLERLIWWIVEDTIPGYYYHDPYFGDIEK